jgi:hypothetical protein
MTDEQKFESIKARYAKADERLEALADGLRRKYGLSSPPSSWITRTEDSKREAAMSAQSKATDAMFVWMWVSSV